MTDPREAALAALMAAVEDFGEAKYTYGYHAGEQDDRGRMKAAEELEPTYFAVRDAYWDGMATELNAIECVCLCGGDAVDWELCCSRHKRLTEIARLRSER